MLLAWPFTNSSEDELALTVSMCGPVDGGIVMRCAVVELL